MGSINWMMEVVGVRDGGGVSDLGGHFQYSLYLDLVIALMITDLFTQIRDDDSHILFTVADADDSNYEDNGDDASYQLFWWR